MLVLIKLLLPVSLYSPLSLGSWFGEKIEYVGVKTQDDTGQHIFQTEKKHDFTPSIRNFGSIEPRGESSPVSGVSESEKFISLVTVNPVPAEIKPVIEPTKTVTKISWQAIIFMLWTAISAALGLVLLKRTVFIRELVSKASDIDFINKKSLLPNDVLKHCCISLGFKKHIPLKISSEATSPVVCGLFRPVILLPQNLISSLSPGQLKAIFFHELAHIRRFDLWVNLLQTILQIIYFYNPLLWLANSIIRRTREQAVDEMVLVAMGKDAGEYPETLVNVAKLAFKRPALTLRLIGVVESEDALSGRIKHILNRPLPKSAKLGLLGLLIVIILAAILLPMARMTHSKMTVINNGPLDIKLVAIRPDGYDLLYDQNGKKLDLKPGPYLPLETSWEDKRQCRDFIFEMPKVEDQLLFKTFQNIKISENNRLIGICSRHYFDLASETLTIVYTSVFDRNYRKKLFPYFYVDTGVNYVNFTLSYYYGPRRDALCTFKGPFALDKTFKTDDNLYKVTFNEANNSLGTGIEMNFQTNQSYDNNTEVIVYDKQGKRYLINSGGGSSGSNGANITYTQFPLTLDEIAYITFGEKPYEITFKNVKVLYSDLQPRTYPEFLDVMAQRLHVSEWRLEQSKKNYSFENPQDAIKVIDIARGPYISKVVEAFRAGTPQIKIPELDQVTQDKIHKIANEWASDKYLEDAGIMIGLIGKWPEFFDFAIKSLGRDEPSNNISPEMERIQNRVKSDMAELMSRNRLDRLTTDQAQKLKQLILKTNDSSVLRYLFYYLDWTNSQETTNALWELVQDKRAWIWWRAINAWYPRATGNGSVYDQVPENIKVKLLLFLSNKSDDSLDAKLKDLLKAEFTPELGKMDSEAFNVFRGKIVTEFNKKEATEIYINYLLQMQKDATERQWILNSSQPVWNVINVIRLLNVWYDINIGNIGIEEPGRGVNIEPRNLPEFKNLIAQALQWYDENKDAKPVELAFSGKAVDTSGNPVVGAKMIFTKMEDYQDERGFKNQRRVVVSQIVTDTNGVYSVVLDPNERWYELNVTANGFLTRERLMVDRLDDGRFLFREYNSQQDNVFIMQHPGRISGTVIDANGQPFAGAELELFANYHYSEIDPKRTVKTNSRGKFDVNGIAADPMLLTYTKLNRVPQGQTSRQEYGGLCGALVIENKEGQEQSGIILDLSKSVCSLELEVKDKDGKPMDSINIYFDVKMPPGSGYTYNMVFYSREENSEGIYKFDGLPPGKWNLRISDNEFPVQRFEVELTPQKIAHYQVNFSSESSRSVNVQALAESLSREKIATETASNELSNKQESWGQEVNGVKARLVSKGNYILFDKISNIRLEVKNESGQRIEVIYPPKFTKRDKEEKGNWNGFGEIKIYNDKGDRFDAEWNYSRPYTHTVYNNGSLSAESRFETYGFPLPGSGKYKARVTFGVQPQNGKTFKVTSNWLDFNALLTKHIPGTPYTPEEALEEARAFDTVLLPNHVVTRTEAVNKFLSVAEKYPDSYYELQAYYWASVILSQRLILPDGHPTQEDRQQGRLLWEKIITKYPDLITGETIFARYNIASTATDQFGQLLDFYEWLSTRTEEKKTESTTKWEGYYPNTFDTSEKKLTYINKIFIETLGTLEPNLTKHRSIEQLQTVIERFPGTHLAVLAENELQKQPSKNSTVSENSNRNSLSISFEHAGLESIVVFDGSLKHVWYTLKKDLIALQQSMSSYDRHEFNKKLTEEEINLFEKWINDCNIFTLPTDIPTRDEETYGSAFITSFEVKFGEKVYKAGWTGDSNVPNEITKAAQSLKDVCVEIQNNSDVNDSDTNKTGVNIYLLADETIDLKKAAAQPLSELVLRDKPWIASDDIEMYDASSHCIYLKKERPQFPFKITSQTGAPFVVTANGQRCYIGTIWPAGSSSLPERTLPLIDMTDFILMPPDIVRIQMSGLRLSSDEAQQIQDKMNDPRIIKAFKEKEQYHAGLEIVLDKVKVSKTDSGSSLTYTYTLTSKDVNDLYVFDPNKMGVGLFHYFNNCPTLFSEEDEHYIRGDNDKIVIQPESPDKFEKSWFSLLKSGQSMTRTITIDAYPEIPQGKYECSFAFHSPGTRFTKGQRAKFDHRVWMGQINTKLNIDVTKNNTSSDVNEQVNAAKAIGDIDPTDMEAIPGLIKAMKDESGRVRVAAAQALLKFGPVNKDVVLAFIEASSDNWKQVMYACDEFFSYLGPQQNYVVPDLIEILKKPDERSKRLALTALSNIGQAAAPALPYILKDINDSNLEAHTFGAIIKIKPDPKIIVPELIKILKNQTKSEKLFAASVLEKIGPNARDAIPALENCIGTNQIEFARALITIDPENTKAVEHLERFAEMPYKPNQWTDQPDAMYLLVKYNHNAEKNLQGLIDALNNQNSRIRLSAASYLGQLGTKANIAIFSLNKVLTDSDPEVRAAAADAILCISSEMQERKEACNVIFSLLDGKYFEGNDNLFMAQVRAADALETFGPSEAWTVPMLITRLNDKNIRIRLEAIDAIGNIGPEARDAIPYLEQLLKNSNWQIRTHASGTIKKIKENSSAQAEGEITIPWGKELNGLRMRLTTPKGNVYKRDVSFPLVIEIQNVSEQSIPFNKLDRFLDFKLTNPQNQRIGVQGGHISSWEAAEGVIKPGEIISDIFYMERYKWNIPSDTNSIIMQFRLPIQKEIPGQLPINEYSNPVTIKLEDNPFGDTLVSNDLPEKWEEDIDIVYREMGGIFYGNLAMHLNGKGIATIIVNGLNQRLPFPTGRHEYILEQSELDQLINNLRQFRIERLNEYNGKMFATDLMEIQFSISKASNTFYGRYEEFGEKTQPVVDLLNLMRQFVTKIVTENKTAVSDELVPLKIEIPHMGHADMIDHSRIPNLENYVSRHVFMVPKGTINVALNKNVTTSSKEIIIGKLSMITDGIKEFSSGNDPLVELKEGLQHITIDLGTQFNLHAIVIWHTEVMNPVYYDVIVQVSIDPEFKSDVVTLFNNDHDNSSGLGYGEDKNYIEMPEGKLIDAKDTKARYVRLYSNGASNLKWNHYVEVEVYGTSIPDELTGTLEAKKPFSTTINEGDETKNQNGAWQSYLEISDELHKAADRQQTATQYLQTAQKYPDTRTGIICLEPANLFEQMVAEDKKFKQVENIEDLSVQEKIDYYIYKLRDVAERESTTPGKTFVLRH